LGPIFFFLKFASFYSNNNFFLFKDKNCYKFFCKTYLSNNLRTYLGLIKGYYSNLFIVGVGYKLIINGFFSFYSCGFSHYLKFLLSKFVLVKVNKYFISIFSISYFRFICFLYKYLNLKLYKTYKLKGIFLKNIVIKLKEGKAIYN
jgi:ribosomal protein L6P/L9E